MKETFNLGILASFAQTPYGAVLEDTSRFGLFFKESEVTSQEWDRLLGADVRTSRHLQLSYGLVRWFMDHDEVVSIPDSTLTEVASVPNPISYTSEERRDLMLAACIHDWGEAVVGDIPAPKKNGDDEKEEKQALHKIINKFCKQFPSYASLKGDMHRVTNTIAFSTDTKLGDTFRAMELMGYCRTMCLAWHQIPHTDGKTREALSNLVRNVMHYSVPKLEKQAERHPAVLAFLSLPQIARDFSEIHAFTQETSA